MNISHIGWLKTRPVEKLTLSKPNCAISPAQALTAPTRLAEPTTTTRILKFTVTSTPPTLPTRVSTWTASRLIPFEVTK